MAAYALYILRTRDGSLYTGITTDLQRRMVEHNTSPKGAKYTRSRRPVVLVYARRFRARSRALRAEAAMKALSRTEKLQLIAGVKVKPQS